MPASGVQQPIIRGIQAVGSVTLLYRYNNYLNDSMEWSLPIPPSFNIERMGLDKDNKPIPVKVTSIAGTSIEVAGTDGAKVAVSKGFLRVAGFRLDSEFLRANPQIASSFQIPLLGGGALALTNNNRSGVLNLRCTKVSTPGTSLEMKAAANSTLGVEGGGVYYDMVLLAQIQQAQEAGDSYGSTIRLAFNFCGDTTLLEFQGCTIANVDPVGLAGNDAADYNIAINYLNWKVKYNASTLEDII